MTSLRRGANGHSALVGGAAALVYCALAARVAGWGDAADIARRAVTSPLRPHGRSYPLHSAATRVLHALDVPPAHASALVSAVSGGLAVGIVHWTCRRVLGLGHGHALAAAAALAFSHTVWSSAVEGEVYALLAAFAALAVASVLATSAAGGNRATAFAAGALVGLSLLHHRAFLAVAPAVLAAPVLAAEAGRRLVAGRDVLAGLLAGGLPYAALVAVEIVSGRGPPDVDTAVRLLVGTPRNATLLLESARPLGAAVAHVARWIAFCLPGTALVAAAAGLFLLVRRRVAGARAMLVLLTLALVLPLRFDAVGDSHVFLVVAHPALAVAAGYALHALAGAGHRRAAALLSASCAVLPVGLVVALGATSLGVRVLPELTPPAAREILVPVRAWSAGSPAWAARVLGSAPSEAPLFCDWGAGGALIYAREVEGIGADVHVLRRLPGPGDLDAAGAAGCLVALTPIWRDPVGRLAARGRVVERVGEDLLRVRLAE